MTLYRICRPLGRDSRVLPRGSISDLSWLTPPQREKLIEVGAVAYVGAPPLAELPGWKLRAPRLAKIGIISIIDFLEAEEGRIQEILKVRPETVRQWKTDVRGLLEAPSPESC